MPEGHTTNSHGVCAVWIFTEQLKRFLHYNSAIYSLSSQAHTCDNTAQNVNSFFPSSHTVMANLQKTARSMTAERPHVRTARQHSTLSGGTDRNRILPSSGILRGVRWFYMTFRDYQSVPSSRIKPAKKGSLEYGPNMQPRNVGFKPPYAS